MKNRMTAMILTALLALSVAACAEDTADTEIEGADPAVEAPADDAVEDPAMDDTMEDPAMEATESE